MALEINIVNWTANHPILQRLRHKVFIEEQGVSEEEEWDNQDSQSSTSHLLASVDGVPAGTARLLETGQIGRLCVLNQFRGQGIGTIMLRRLMQFALANNADEIWLNAQVKVIQWYQQFGFTHRGDVFMEAGIEHQQMVFDPGIEEALVRIYQDEVLRLSQPHEYLQHMTQMLSLAKRSVEIYSQNLLPLIYGDKYFVEALSEFVRSNRYAQVRILLQDPKPLYGSHHLLLVLAQRLPSKVDIRILIEPQQNQSSGYMTVEKRHLVYFNEENEFKGFANYSAVLESEHELDEFNRLWERQSKEDPNFSLLRL